MTVLADRKKYVVIYARSWRRNLFLLTLKDRPAWQAGRLNLPGGKMDPEDNGDPIACAIRELKEETGLDPMPAPSAVSLRGSMEGNRSIVYAVSIMVNHEIPLKPREGETEVVKWYEWPFIRDDPRVLPNLQIVVPLCAFGAPGWKLEDYHNDDQNPTSRPHMVHVTV